MWPPPWQAEAARPWARWWKSSRCATAAIRDRRHGSGDGCDGSHRFSDCTDAHLMHWCPKLNLIALLRVSRQLLLRDCAAASTVRRDCLIAILPLNLALMISVLAEKKRTRCDAGHPLPLIGKVGALRCAPGLVLSHGRFRHHLYSVCIITCDGSDRLCPPATIFTSIMHSSSMERRHERLH